MSIRTGGALLAICGILGGCAAIKSATDPKLMELAGKLPLPEGLAEKFAYYQKYASKFRQFHDTGDLEDNDVLDVLRDTGVLPPGAPKPPRPGAPKPAPGPKQVPPPVQTYSGRYVWPTDAGVVSSEFGDRWGKKHKGMDIAAEVGEAVRATASGVVIYAGSGLRGYGNAIILRHDSKKTSLYAHNSRLLAAQGQKVKGGQEIAKLGNTGRSTGPHVHFEIRDGDKPVDPRKLLGKSAHHAT